MDGRGIMNWEVVIDGIMISPSKGPNSIKKTGDSEIVFIRERFDLWFGLFGLLCFMAYQPL